MKAKEQNLTQAGTVLLLSAIVVKLIGALFKIPLSSDYALGDLGFGYFSSVYDLYTPIYTLALSGFPVAIARMIAEFTANNDLKSSRNTFVLAYKALLVLGIIGCFVFCGISLPIMFSRTDNSVYSFLAVAPSIIFCCIISVYRGYFEGLKNMVPTAISNIIEALCKLCLGLTGAVITMKITGDPALSSAAALFGITLGTVISCLYLKLTFKSEITFKLREKVYDKALFQSFIAIVIPVAIASLSVGITAFIDSITLRPQLESLIRDSSNAELLLRGTLYKNVNDGEIPTLIYGIKGKAYTLFNLVPTLTTALGVGAVPLITEYYAKGNRAELRRNTDLCLKLSSVLCMPIGFGFMAIGQGITQLLYGSKSAVLGGELLGIYGIAAIFAGLTVPTMSLLQAVSRQKAALINISVGIAVKLICNLCLTPISALNVYGAVIGTVVCFIVIFILNIAALVKAMGFVPCVSQCFLKPMIAAFTCSVAAFLADKYINSSMGTVVGIGIAGIVYLTLLWLLKVINKEEIIQIVKK